jgi:putative colanic acid biosynthesis acetyltransferase WcaF
LTESYDILANRKAIKWTRKELAGRLLWAVLRRPFFAWTPRQFWGLRRGVLRLFGARIGDHVHIHPTVAIEVPWNLDIGEAAAIGDGARIYNLGMVTIGMRATVSQHAHLCAGTHDYTKPDFPLVKTPISIGADAWICADAFVGPSVNIGERAIIGARAVAVSDALAGTISVGNPARVIKSRSQDSRRP